MNVSVSAYPPVPGKERKLLYRLKEVIKTKGIPYLLRTSLQVGYNKLGDLCLGYCCRAYSLLYCKLFRHPFIHVIGDSHARAFKRTKQFIVHHIGPATAHNLNKEWSTTNSWKQLRRLLEKIGTDHFLILTFGEIDCRIHIYYQFRKQQGKYPIRELISRTIKNYGEVLQKIQEMKINFFVYSIPPATRQKNIFGYP